MVGPLRSLAWLAGLDELVEAIDQPAYTISDEIAVVPQGADIPVSLSRHWEEGNIPTRIWNKVASEPVLRTAWSSGLTVRQQIPADVNETPTAYNPQDLYGISRIQPSAGSVQCMKVRCDKNSSRLETRIRRLAGRFLISDKVWYRGTTISALISTLYFLIPQRSTQPEDNEFGPGFYTTDSLQYAVEYAAGGGAIMVFRDPDSNSTQCWQPNLEEWNFWVARWLGLRLAIADQPIPPQVFAADFIQGAISGDRRGRRSNSIPAQGPHQQLVAISYKGCEALSKCLEMIIFIERR